MTDWDEAEHVRERLAHQLHDGPIQELTAAQLFLDGVLLRMQDSGADGELRDSLERGLTALRRATLACRDMMESLRPGVEGDGELAARLARLADSVLPEGEAALHIPRTLGTLRPDLGLVVYRAMEELAGWLAGQRKTLAKFEVAASGDGLHITAEARSGGVFPAGGDLSWLPRGWRAAAARGQVTVSADGQRLALAVPSGRGPVPHP